MKKHKVYIILILFVFILTSCDASNDKGSTVTTTTIIESQAEKETYIDELLSRIDQLENKTDELQVIIDEMQSKLDIQYDSVIDLFDKNHDLFLGFDQIQNEYGIGEYITAVYIKIPLVSSSYFNHYYIYTGEEMEGNALLFKDLLRLIGTAEPSDSIKYTEYSVDKSKFEIVKLSTSKISFGFSAFLVIVIKDDLGNKYAQYIPPMGDI